MYHIELEKGKCEECDICKFNNPWYKELLVKGKTIIKKVDIESQRDKIHKLVKECPHGALTFVIS